MANQIRTLSDLLAQLEPGVAAAFKAAMEDWRNNMDLAAVVRAISNNDILGAVAAMHLDPAALQPILDALTQSYNTSGVATVKPYPKVTSPRTGAKLLVRFNGRDPIAEAWLRQNGADFVSNVTSAQEEAIRIALTAGLQAGDNPTVTALDLVGRIGQKGKRQGGIIGLNAPQTQFLVNATAELRSTDPQLLRNYLNRGLRDKRFDGSALRAIAGEKIPASIRTQMLVSYSNRMLKLRGDTIARTETLAALHAGQHEAVRQTLVTSGIKPSAATKGWKSAHDSKVRHTHQLLDGKVVPFDRPFVSSSGARLMYPGDRSLGAGADEVVHCRCIAPVRIDFLQGVK